MYGALPQKCRTWSQNFKLLKNMIIIDRSFRKCQWSVPLGYIEIVRNKQSKMKRKNHKTLWKNVISENYLLWLIDLLFPSLLCFLTQIWTNLDDKADSLIWLWMLPMLLTWLIVLTLSVTFDIKMIYFLGLQNVYIFLFKTTFLPLVFHNLLIRAYLNLLAVELRTWTVILVSDVTLRHNT